MRFTLLAALAVATAAAQTQIDLRTQAKGVDFSAATATKPLKAGTELPATCSVGEMFFKTDAQPGVNLYACTEANHWSAQSSYLTISSDGTVIGTRPITNFRTGPGLISVMADTGSQVDVSWALDTAVVQTQPGEQSGAALLCASDGNSSTDYRCHLDPMATAYTTGMVLRWIPDVGAAGGITTLNVDTLGAARVKLQDGLSDPSATDIMAGRLYEIWYDGAEFRLITPVAVSAANAGPLVFDGSTTLLADGSTVSWTCGSGSGAQCTTGWTAPAGINWVRVQAWSAGAGGGGSTAGTGVGPGGGGGGFWETTCPVTPGNTYSVAVGLGGPGANGVYGVTLGGNSSFGTCFTLLGGAGYGPAPPQATGCGGRLYGTVHLGQFGLQRGATLANNGTYCTAPGVAGGHSLRLDGGGSGGPGPDAGLAGWDGGSAVAGGGGGGAGGYNNATGGAGGLSGVGGGGGNGGGWTAGGGYVACTAGSIPGGGGGSAGGETAGGSNHTGCAGARGEIRVFYAN